MSTLAQQHSPSATSNTQPTPMRFFEVMNAYQQTAVLRAAIELDLFTAVGETSGALAELIARLNVPRRGLRVLCDYLVVLGFLGKYVGDSEVYYSLTTDSAMFLHRKSPRYLGGAVRFLGSPLLKEAFTDLAAVVRAGGPVSGQQVSTNEVLHWLDFARGMAPLLYPVAERVAGISCTGRELKILDVAASHGLFGICASRVAPDAEIVALDFPSVLEITRENVERHNLNLRFTFLPGDARDIELGAGYDLVLVPNLIHHWDRETIQAFYRKVHASLNQGGKIALVEFAPNDDRVSPPVPALFALNMLAMTPAGDAYTLYENMAMLLASGFTSCEDYPLHPFPQTCITAARKE